MGGSLVWLPLGRVLGWVAWLFLAWTIWVVEQTARLAGTTPGAGSIRLGHVWAWYAVLGAGAWWMWQTEERRRMLWQGLGTWLRANVGSKVLLGALGIVAVLVWAAALSLPDGRLHVAFLDVGAGDAVWIETPSGRQVVINGGASGTAMAAHLGRRVPFWDRTLDVAVATDGVEEHVLGLVPVLERYHVGQLWHPFATTETSVAGERIRTLAEAGGTIMAQALTGTRIEFGDGVVLSFVHPAARDGRAASATVVRVDYGSTCFLLSASADLSVEREMLVREENVRCDVLQVGAQGGEGATSLPYLEAVRPVVAVVSCAREGRGAPDERTLTRLVEAGATTIRTDESGSIEVISDGTAYTVRRGR